MDAAGLLRAELFARDHRVHPVLMQSPAAGEAGPTFTITPILDSYFVAGLDVRCPCGRHAYIELDPSEEAR